jgi:hypothetical protein
VKANRVFFENYLGARLTEQIILDDGTEAGADVERCDEVARQPPSDKAGAGTLSSKVNSTSI